MIQYNVNPPPIRVILPVFIARVSGVPFAMPPSYNAVIRNLQLIA
jgi:hypothetical protein